jgi:hypothetical protein
MEAQELTGYYTYRSLLDNPLPVDDFNRIKFAEAEIFLIVEADGTPTGGDISYSHHSSYKK